MSCLHLCPQVCEGGSDEGSGRWARRADWFIPSTRIADFTSLWCACKSFKSCCSFIKHNIVTDMWSADNNKTERGSIKKHENRHITNRFSLTIFFEQLQYCASWRKHANLTTHKSACPNAMKKALQIFTISDRLRTEFIRFTSKLAESFFFFLSLYFSRFCYKLEVDCFVSSPWRTL